MSGSDLFSLFEAVVVASCCCMIKTLHTSKQVWKFVRVTCSPLSCSWRSLQPVWEVCWAMEVRWQQSGLTSVQEKVTPSWKVFHSNLGTIYNSNTYQRNYVCSWSTEKGADNLVLGTAKQVLMHIHQEIHSGVKNAEKVFVQSVQWQFVFCYFFSKP